MQSGSTSFFITEWNSLLCPYSGWLGLVTRGLFRKRKKRPSYPRTRQDSWKEKAIGSVRKRSAILDVETHEARMPNLNSHSQSILLRLENDLNTSLMCVFSVFLNFWSHCPMFGPFVHRVWLLLRAALGFLHLFPLLPCSSLPFFLLFFACPKTVLLSEYERDLDI